jgi:hypothetical protein
MPKRKVDVFAGSGSTAGKVRKQRQAMEKGDPTMGRPVVGGQPGLDAMGEPIDDNSDDEVVKRGYRIERDET